MGNRATIIFTDLTGLEIGPAIYLHWNGGPESIYAFLDELDRRRVRSDVDYSSARFIHVVGDYFDGADSAGSMSLGVTSGPPRIDEDSLERYDHCDNGIYVVQRQRGRSHVRRFTRGGELTPEQVANEEALARQHDYHRSQPDCPSIAETFVSLRPKLSNT